MRSIFCGPHCQRLNFRCKSRFPNAWNKKYAKRYRIAVEVRDAAVENSREIAKKHRKMILRRYGQVRKQMRYAEKRLNPY